MTWVRFRRWLYFPLLAVFFGGAFLLAAYLYRPTPAGVAAIGALIAALLIPGILGRLVLRDLLASRAHHGRAHYMEALGAARRFLDLLKRRPWIRHAIWTQFGVYSLSVEAMALNNAGAALLEMVRFDEARGQFMRARDIDPNYSIAAFNLAVIAKLLGDRELSEELAREAAKLGYANGDLDAILNGIGQTYARLATRR